MNDDKPIKITIKHTSDQAILRPLSDFLADAGAKSINELSIDDLERRLNEIDEYQDIITTPIQDIFETEIDALFEKYPDACLGNPDDKSLMNVDFEKYGELSDAILLHHYKSLDDLRANNKTFKQSELEVKQLETICKKKITERINQQREDDSIHIIEYLENVNNEDATVSDIKNQLAAVVYDEVENMLKTDDAFSGRMQDWKYNRTELGAVLLSGKVLDRYFECVHLKKVFDHYQNDREMSAEIWRTIRGTYAKINEKYPNDIIDINDQYEPMFNEEFRNDWLNKHQKLEMLQTFRPKKLTAETSYIHTENYKLFRELTGEAWKFEREQHQKKINDEIDDIEPYQTYNKTRSEQILTLFDWTKLKDEQGIVLSEPVTIEDIPILRVVHTFYEQGCDQFTIRQLYEKITNTNNNSGIRSETLEDLKKRLKRLSMIYVKVQINGFSQRLDDGTTTITDPGVEGALIPLRIEFGKVNGKKVEVFHILECPPFLWHARLCNHRIESYPDNIFVIENKQFKDKVKDPETGKRTGYQLVNCNSSLRKQVFEILLSRVQQAKSGSKSGNKEILLKYITDRIDFGDVSKWTRSRNNVKIKETIIEILDYWESVDFIKGYKLDTKDEYKFRKITIDV